MAEQEIRKKILDIWDPSSFQMPDVERIVKIGPEAVPAIIDLLRVPYTRSDGASADLYLLVRALSDFAREGNEEAFDFLSEMAEGGFSIRHGKEELIRRIANAAVHEKKSFEKFVGSLSRSSRIIFEELPEPLQQELPRLFRELRKIPTTPKGDIQDEFEDMMRETTERYGSKGSGMTTIKGNLAKIYSRLLSCFREDIKGEDPYFDIDYTHPCDGILTIQCDRGYHFVGTYKENKYLALFHRKY